VGTSWTVARVAHMWKERLAKYGTANLISSEVISVRVASFTFKFRTIEQLRDCIHYYEQKVHPSSRIAAKEIEEDLGPD
jgi:hypothetical protein